MLKKDDVDGVILKIANCLDVEITMRGVDGRIATTMPQGWHFEEERGRIPFKHIVCGGIAKIGKYALGVVDEKSDWVTRSDIMLYCFASEIRQPDKIDISTDKWESAQLVKTIRDTFSRMFDTDAKGYVLPNKREGGDFFSEGRLGKKVYRCLRVRKNRHILWKSELAFVVCYNLCKIIDGYGHISELCSGIALAAQFLQEFNPKYLEK